MTKRDVVLARLLELRRLTERRALEEQFARQADCLGAQREGELHFVERHSRLGHANPCRQGRKHHQPHPTRSAFMAPRNADAPRSESARVGRVFPRFDRRPASRIAALGNIIGRHIVDKCGVFA